MTEIIFHMGRRGRGSPDDAFLFHRITVPLAATQFGLAEGVSFGGLRTPPLGGAAVLGTGVSFETSKTVAVCRLPATSWKTEVRDMKDPQSEKGRPCITRTTTSGKTSVSPAVRTTPSSGTEKAKMNGLRHVYANIFKEVRNPCSFTSPTTPPTACIPGNGEFQKKIPHASRKRGPA